jgi:squalene cyclase
MAQQDGAPELTLEASQAIDKGLKYLLSTQHKDGSWSSDGKGVNAVASTSLA